MSQGSYYINMHHSRITKALGKNTRDNYKFNAHLIFCEMAE